MGRVRLGIGVMLLALVGPACGPRTTSQKAARDQEITTAILWEYHRQDPRFRDVRVATMDGVITLEGRVTDAKSAQDAMQIALGHARGGQVDSRIQIRPR